MSPLKELVLARFGSCWAYFFCNASVCVGFLWWYVKFARFPYLARRPSSSVPGWVAQCLPVIQFLQALLSSAASAGWFFVFFVSRDGSQRIGDDILLLFLFVHFLDSCFHISRSSGDWILTYAARAATAAKRLEHPGQSVHKCTNGDGYTQKHCCRESYT